MADILVIDDDSFMTEMVGELLRDKGHLVRTAEDGAAGLREALRQAPQLVILDMNMPKMDGYELSRRLKANDSTKKVPILALTAQSSMNSYQDAYSAGCDGFLAKPLDATRLYEKLDLLLRFRP